MDNKIKIVFIFLIGLLFLSSCAFDSNTALYLIRINEWANISYWLEKDNDSTKISSFRLFWTNEDFTVNKKYAIKDYDIFNEMEQNSQIIIYTDDFILLKDAGGSNSVTSEQYRKFYLITPNINEREEGRHSFSKEEITRKVFDSIGTNCEECRVIDIKLLKEFIANGMKELKPKSVK